MIEKITKKYYAQLVKEAWINAILASLIVGLSVLLVSAVAFWAFGFKHAWIAFIIAGVAIGGCAPLFYFKKYRPSKKQVAKRVDELGLEERLLTMAELEGDNSYMAMRQREDAKKAIASIQSQNLKIAASIPLIIVSCILLPCSFAMSAVAIASADGKLSSGKDILDDITEPEPVFYTVEFVEEGGGILEGDELMQLVEEGGTIKPVFAIPDDECYLEEWTWTIGTETYSLTETDEFFVDGLKVYQDMTITAVFAEIGEPGEGEEGEGGEGEGAQGGQQEADSDEGEPQGGEGEEGEEKEGEGEEGEGESDENKDGEIPPKEGEGGDGSSGTPQDRDKVIDGETDYGGEVYKDAVEEAEGEIESNDEIPDGDKEIIRDYLDNIKK